jgi:hypothetical protein
MTQKNILVGVVVVVVAVAGYFFYSKQQNQNELVNTQNPTTQSPTADESFASLTEKDKQTLESIAFAAVDQKTKGQWDKKIDIRRVDSSQNAVEGGWWAKDRWHWIAWRQSGGNWNVLASLDGFDCKELESLPAQYESFFRELLYMPSGEKYCYSHASRTNP